MEKFYVSGFELRCQVFLDLGFRGPLKAIGRRHIITAAGTHRLLGFKCCRA